MADLRNPLGSPPLPAARPVAPARSEAVRAAQRAFFEAALGQPSTPAAAPSVTAAPAAPPPRTAMRVDPQSPPERILRPGSLVDIKV